jgi:threonine/homoserine/homoserine lactone efflux protein
VTIVPDLTTLSLFVIAALVLLLTPGPAVLYIVARSINQGRRAGLASVLGIEVANMVHVAAAALGLSALLLSSALAFSVLKYLGAAYLIYLGVRKLLAKEEAEQAAIFEQKALSRVFSEGILVNLLNPKPPLFFLAFLPQFVDVSRGSVLGQTLILGLVFVLLAITTDSLYALLSGTFGRWLTGHRHFLRMQQYLTGSVYIGLGVATALTGSGKK